MRRWCIFEYHHQFSSCIFSLVRAHVISPVNFFHSSLPLTFFSYLTTLNYLSQCASLFSPCLFLFAPRGFSLQSPKRSRGRYWTTPSQRVKTQVTSLFSHCCQHEGVQSVYFFSVVVGALFMQILEYKCGIHTGLSLVFSEVCGGLPWPIVRRDGASRQCGASQCGRVSVCLQGGPGLRGPGDSGLWHEGNAQRTVGCNNKERDVESELTVNILNWSLSATSFFCFYSTVLPEGK